MFLGKSRSWSTRSTSHFRCPEVRYVSVGVRIFFLRAWNCWGDWALSTLPTSPILALPIGTLWLCRSVGSLWANMLLVPYLLLSAPRVATVLVPPSDVCCGWCVFYQWSHSAAVATCSRFGPSARRSHAFTCFSFTILFVDSVDTTCFLRYRSSMRVYFFFTACLLRSRAFWCNCEPSQELHVFTQGFPVQKTLVGNVQVLFLDFVTCCKKSKSTFVECVSWSFVIAIRFAQYCVCDHEKISWASRLPSSFSHVVDILRNILVLLVAVFWQHRCHQFVLVWRLKILSNQRLHNRTFSLFVIHRLIWFLLALRDQYKSSVLGQCHHATDFTRVVYMHGRVGFLWGDPIHLHWVFCFPNWIVCACNSLCFAPV